MARELVDQLENKIVNLDAAAADDDTSATTDDRAPTVPGTPEPPD
jgi:hypothetical protein